MRVVGTSFSMHIHICVMVCACVMLGSKIINCSFIMSLLSKYYHSHYILFGFTYNQLQDSSKMHNITKNMESQNNHVDVVHM